MFSVSSNFTVIFARSKLFTTFLKSVSGLRIHKGCDAFFLIAIFLNYGVKVIIKAISFPCFYENA